jgi:hypothetical protein
MEEDCGKDEGPQPFFCQICFSQIERFNELVDSVEVPHCGHRFCRECFIVFLESSINSGRLDLKCFHMRPKDIREVKGGETVESATTEKWGNASDDTNIPKSPSPLVDEIWEPHDPDKHSICSQQIDKDFVLEVLATHDAISANSVQNNASVTITLHPPNVEGDAPAVQRINNISKGSQLVSRYLRLLFMKNHEDGRECPKCFYLQQCHESDRGKCWPYFRPGSGTRAMLDQETQPQEDKSPGVGAPSSSSSSGTITEGPQMNPNDVMCANPECLHVYCFEHSDAHPGRSCEEYRAQTAEETAVSEGLIASTSKLCPGCGIPVTKQEGVGCNHMKCPHCDCAFCWLCGEEIEDTVFPSHFAYWNLKSRCTNLQMDASTELPWQTRAFANATTCVERLLLGPLAVLSTFLSLLLCCCCLPTALSNQRDHMRFGRRGTPSAAYQPQEQGMEEVRDAEHGQSLVGAPDTNSASATIADPRDVGLQVHIEGLNSLEEGSPLKGESVDAGPDGVGVDDSSLPPGRAWELLLGNCMNSWSIFWGTVVIGVPAAFLLFAGVLIYVIGGFLVQVFCILPTLLLERCKLRMTQRAWRNALMAESSQLDEQEIGAIVEDAAQEQQNAREVDTAFAATECPASGGEGPPDAPTSQTALDSAELGHYDGLRGDIDHDEGDSQPSHTQELLPHPANSSATTLGRASPDHSRTNLATNVRDKESSSNSSGDGRSSSSSAGGSTCEAAGGHVLKRDVGSLASTSRDAVASADIAVGLGVVSTLSPTNAISGATCRGTESAED